MAAFTAEVAGTLSLLASDGFSRVGFTTASMAGYAEALVLSWTRVEERHADRRRLRDLGSTRVVFVAVLGKLVFGDVLTAPIAAGTALIVPVSRQPHVQGR